MELLVDGGFDLPERLLETSSYERIMKRVQKGR
jgi:hypothetical protein